MARVGAVVHERLLGRQRAALRVRLLVHLKHGCSNNEVLLGKNVPHIFDGELFPNASNG